MLKTYELPKCWSLSLVFYAGGTRNSDTQWLVDQIKSFIIYREGQKKPTFQYRLPYIGECCRPAWVTAVGFPNPRNSRVHNIEAVLRRNRGKFVTKVKRNVSKFDTGTFYAKAFLEEYICTHHQDSPCRTYWYVEFHGIEELFRLYEKELKKIGGMYFVVFCMCAHILARLLHTHTHRIHTRTTHTSHTRTYHTHTHTSRVV